MARQKEGIQRGLDCKLEDVKNDLQEMGDKASARAQWEIVTKGTVALRGLQSQNVKYL